MKRWWNIGFYSALAYIAIFALAYLSALIFLPGEPFSYAMILSFFPCILLFQGEPAMFCVYAGPMINLVLVMLLATSVAYICLARKPYK